MRAEEHVRALEVEVRRYVQSRPYRQIAEYHPEHGALIRGLGITQEPSPQVALQIGDFLHNIRASLDHLAWNLVLANGRQPGKRTRFPIVDAPPIYKGKVSTVRVAGGIDAGALATIDSLQPYPGRNPGDGFPHALRVIRDLSNIDKHRHLLVTGTWIATGNRFEGWVPGAPDDKGTIFIFAEALPVATDVSVYAEKALDVAFREPPVVAGWPVAEVLPRLLKFVRDDVHARLTPFLR